MYVMYESGMKVPAKIWATEGTVEEGCIQQLKNISSLPFTFKHTVLCPDGHMGYGMPIGGVLAADGVVVPNAVGLDIGCGMVAARLDIQAGFLQPHLKKIVNDIKRVVPLGFNKHKDGVNSEKDLPDSMFSNYGLHVIPREIENAIKSMGTLGGGK